MRNNLPRLLGLISICTLALTACGDGSTSATANNTSQASVGQSSTTTTSGTSTTTTTTTTTMAAGAMPTPGFPVTHHGRWLVDAQGRVVIFHGINVAMKEKPYTPQAQGFTEADAAMLAQEGFSTVRVWVFWSAIEPSPGVWDDSSLVALRQFVGWLHEYGISTTLNFSQVLWGEKFGGLGFPTWAANDDGLPSLSLGSLANSLPTPGGALVVDGLTNPGLHRALDHFWANDKFPANTGLQDQFAQAWVHVATYFRDVPGILAYDLVNEPAAGSQEPTCFNPLGCPLFDALFLTPFNERIATAIRQVDKTHLIYYEPEVLASAGFATYVGAGKDSNLALTFHFYPAAGSSGLSLTAPLAFANFENDATTHGDGLLLSEFGASDDLTLLSGILDAADKARLGWLYWAWYSTEPTGDATTPTTEVVHPEEGIVIDPTKPPIEANLKSAKLAVLGRPYPYLVSGTPTSWSFDSSSRTFTLTYSTVPVAGGTPISAPTVIVVPTRQYPQGSYQVSVTGASITSAAGAPALTLLTLPGATTVTVTVKPQ